MFRSKNPKVNVSIPRKVLEAIFDECDKYDVDETGGRIVGTYHKKRGQYDIEVLGLIGPGPNAKRSPTSFFQDGDYQEQVFRSIEEKHPDVEHLGNWHTHHVNGLSTLSSGDKATYHRVVNHDKHNTDFFYALLVVRKSANRGQRYEIKHYFVCRKDDTIYEIPHSQINILEQSDLRAVSTEGVSGSHPSSHEVEIAADANLERAKDQELFSEFYRNLKPAFSTSLGALYWKGQIPLVDGSEADVLVMESSNTGGPTYSIAITGSKAPISAVSESYKELNFKSARHAVWQLQRDVDRELYAGKKG